MVTPGVVPLSMSRLNASDIRCNLTRESPSDSGLAWGRAGVCGAAWRLPAVCAVMVSLPLALVVLLAGSISSGYGQVWRRTAGLNRALTASRLQSGRCLCLKRLRSAATLGSHRGVAQLVEYRSPKPVVAGSSP